MLKPDRFSCSQKIWLKWDPPVHGLFDGSSDGLWFPSHYGEVVQCDDVSCGLGNRQRWGERALKCSLYLSPKFLPVSPMYSMVQPGRSQLYLYITPPFYRCCPNPWKLILTVLGTPEMYLHSHFPAYVSKTFHWAL